MKASELTKHELSLICYGLAFGCDNLYKMYEHHKDKNETVYATKLKKEYDEMWGFYQKLDRILDDAQEKMVNKAKCEHIFNCRIDGKVSCVTCGIFSEKTVMERYEGK